MGDKISNKEWLNEYQTYLVADRVRPPDGLRRQVKQIVHSDLNPSVWKVFCKLFAIHFISGTVTLFFCPQFGLSFHDFSKSMLVFLSRFGEYGCMFGCGALFLGVTGMTAVTLLRNEEIRVIRKNTFLQLAFLALMSLGLILSFQEQEAILPWGLFATWLIGAVAGGFFTIQIGWAVRLKLRRALA